MQGPGETIYMPVLLIFMSVWLLLITFSLLEKKSPNQGHLAHAVMNIDANLSVTENLFLPDSLEDWVHG